jgi:hypothetical protein
MNFLLKIKGSIANSFFLILLIIILLLPFFVFAQGPDILGKLSKVGNTSGYNTENQSYPLAQVVGMVINALLGLLGVIFVAYIILAGYNWMTANGEEAKVTKAKDTIKHSIIGLIIMVSAFSIWNFIYDNLLK